MEDYCVGNWLGQGGLRQGHHLEVFHLVGEGAQLWPVDKDTEALCTQAHSSRSDRSCGKAPGEALHREALI